MKRVIGVYSSPHLHWVGDSFRKSTASEINDAKKLAADLHWLAFLLIGSREIAIDVAAEAVAAPKAATAFFSDWILAWSRRVAIAKALASVREELNVSASRTKSRRPDRPAIPARGWTLPPETTKLELEGALLSIDIFPRAALLLTVFEGASLQDAAILLDASPALVKRGQIIGLREVTMNLAGVPTGDPLSTNTGM
jgi:DNA-directed RNA polymerase specialized sigma24 family protein